MSRDFILVFSGGLVSLMTTLVVLFVMDYYYRRLNRERGASSSRLDSQPAAQPVAPVIAKAVQAPKPVVPTATVSVQAPQPVVSAQRTQVAEPKPVAPAPKPVESKPMPAYVPSKDSLLPPQLRPKPATQEKSVEPAKPTPQPKAQEHQKPAPPAKEEKPAAQEKETLKPESQGEPPMDSLLPPETIK